MSENLGTLRYMVFKAELDCTLTLFSGGSKQVKFDDLNGTQASKHISDLSQEFSYVFSLRAFTSIGHGEEITKSVLTGPQTG